MVASPGNLPLAAPTTTRQWLSLVAIPITVVLLYAPTLSAPFVFDDATSVQLNPAIQRLWPLSDTFSGTRPLLNSSYAVTYWLGGGGAWAHRSGNIALHLLNALLVYAWLVLTFRVPRFAAHGGARAHAIALTVALLFAVHPLQTEAVTYVSGRAEALAASWTLIAMCAAACCQFRLASGSAGGLFARVGIVAAVGLGIMSKENAAATPLLLLVYDCLASGRSPIRVLRAEWPVYATLALGAATLFWLVMRNPEYSHSAGFGFAATPWGISPSGYLLTQPGVIVRYLRLLILPVGQSFDYEWPVAADVASPLVWAPALLLLVGAAFAWCIRRRAPLYTLGIAWFFIALAPTSSVIPIADVIAERRVYLASIGVFLVVVLAATDAASRLAAWGVSSGALRTTLLVAATGVVGVLGWLTVERNLVWQDALRLWQDSARTSPDSPRVRTNLGARYLERGDYAAARTELERAMELIRTGRSHQATPRQAAYAQTYLAVVYLKQLEIDRAAEAYQQAIDLGGETYVPLQRTLRQIRDALVRVGDSMR